jgi:glycosyltransferase involved in cell wall biosynthesis
VVSGLAPEHGGPSYSIPRLCAALHDLHAQVHLLTVGPDHISHARELFADISTFSQNLKGLPLGDRLRFSKGLSSALRSISHDLIHVHGLWLMPNLYAGWAASRSHRPLIVSPRGMVSDAALQFSKMKKKLFWQFLQGPAYARAACWHATSQMEAEEIRAIGISAPIAVIPNGIDLPKIPELVGNNVMPTLLSLGRIHPKKGLDRLLHAWSRIASRHSEWSLRIAGPDEGDHSNQLRQLASQLAAPRVHIEGPLYGEQKWKALAEARLFVLPSLSENFGLSVAESLGAGTPVISTKGAPWSGLVDHHCGWWIDHGVESLAAALDQAMSQPTDILTKMGEHGRDWMSQDFSWYKVATSMLALYYWNIKGGPVPEFVSSQA